MTRAVVGVLLVGLVVVAVALLVDRAAFTDSGGVTTSPISPTGPVVAERGPAATADTADAGDSAEQPAAEVSSAVLVHIRGTVSVRGADGAWRPARPDEALGVDDHLRSGRNSEATLRMGNGVLVRLSPRSELSVRELTEAMARVRLEEGHVTATVEGSSGRTLRVQAKGSDAEAESTDGSFGVVTDGKGQLAVATTTGRVKLTAQGESVEVGAGETATVLEGAAPTSPTATPNNLYLKLGKLAATQTNKTNTTVEGTTSPGAVVRVGDVSTTSDNDGRFALRVPLRDGKNDLAIEVTDALGRQQDQRLPAVVVDREKPKIDAAVQWGTPN
jgi:hypothetical protein